VAGPIPRRPELNDNPQYPHLQPSVEAALRDIHGGFSLSLTGLDLWQPASRQLLLSISPTEPVGSGECASGGWS
jgi:hypothetical protein